MEDISELRALALRTAVDLNNQIHDNTTRAKGAEASNIVDQAKVLSEFLNPAPAEWEEKVTAVKVEKGHGLDDLDNQDALGNKPYGT